MAFAVKLEKFEGPLDLLLELIEAAKLDISQISLARVTDEYLTRLQENPQIPPEELADFLVVASRLLYIKSRLLLPFLNLGEAEAEGDLEAQLKIYKEYLEASRNVAAMIGRRRFLFVHEKLPHVEIGFAPPKKLTADQLADAGEEAYTVIRVAPPKKLTSDQLAELFRTVLRRLELIVRLPQAVIEKTVSIHEKITEIQALVSKAVRMTFKEMMASAGSRIEIVVSFLALLELIKQKAVSVSQSDLFEDITIEKTEAVPA